MLGLSSKDHGGKRFHNVFSTGHVTVNTGYLVCLVLIVASLLVSSIIGGPLVLLIGLSNVVVGLLYSWKSIRLKSQPIIDILSHCYLLAISYPLFLLVLPGAQLDIWALLLTIALGAYSLGGDLDNEYRDFDEDTAAGLKNTASYLGKQNTMWVSRIMRISATVIIIFVIVRIVAS